MSEAARPQAPRTPAAAPPDSVGADARPDAPRDRFGRVIDYLRISLTDRCNLRCLYCMPLEQPDLADEAHLLSADELVEVVRTATSIGFRKFRLTGGEPTLRRDVVGIVRRIAEVPGVEDLAMTTNGVRLPALAAPLAEAGLQRVNVHVDTLSPSTLPRLMRLGAVDTIRAGIAAAEDAGLRPIKLNVVVVRGFNDEEVADLAALTLEHDWHVRFIELMPLGGGAEARVSVSRFVSNVATRARIEQRLGELEPLPRTSLSDESENFTALTASGRAPGTVGFISPVTRPYCGGCNRMRLTADGRFHLCLLHDTDLDVRAALRRAGTDEERRGDVRRILLAAVAGKPTGHALDQGVHTRGRRMHQIGG